MNDDPHPATRLAIDLAAAAGNLAREAFGTPVVMDVKSSPLDVVTEIDRAAERLIISGLRQRYPRHAISSEEAGRHGRSPRCEWLIDPLDGTHNFAIGVPLYGVALVLIADGVPVLATVRDAHGGRQVAASRGRISTSGGLQIYNRVGGTPVGIALQQGYGVRRDDPQLEAIRSRLEARYMRVLYTWAPVIDLLLLLSGAIGGIVGYRCVGAEHVAARFIAEQAGCVVRILDRVEPGPHDKATYVMAWPELAPDLVEDVTSSDLLHDRGR